MAVHSGTQDEKLSELCAMTLKRGSTMWNSFAQNWNSGGKEKILQKFADAQFLDGDREHSKEVSLVRNLAGSATSLPYLRYDGDDLVLYDPKSDEELLRVENLKTY